jgi:hypothetical protein
MLRLRLCEPVPHDLVHTVQAENAEVVQCTGQGPWLHVFVSRECGHAAPPNLGSTVVRLRDVKPAAHDVVQVDQLEKLPTAQLTGHACTLQARVSAECGHAAPPCCGSVVARLRDWKPLPHDFVQVDHALSGPTTQSTAHAGTLQARVSAECGHGLPPYEATGATVLRVRCCEPPPHDLVHADHALKVDTAQSIGQGKVLQLLVSFAYGHATPP